MTELEVQDVVELYLPLVRKLVDQVKLTLPPHVDGDDLYVVGIQSLATASRTYQSNQEGFDEYAIKQVCNALVAELRRLERPVKNRIVVEFESGPTLSYMPRRAIIDTPCFPTRYYVGEFSADADGNVTPRYNDRLEQWCRTEDKALEVAQKLGYKL